MSDKHSSSSSSSSDDESFTIVIDNGTGICKAGFAGDDAPRAVFPSCVGRPKNTGQPGWQYKDTYVGDEAQPKKYPMEHGIVKDWDDMEKVWHHVFYNELRVDPEKYLVLITESPLNPKSNSEKMAEVLFERFNVPGVLVVNTALMSLYSNGCDTGVVLESGDGGTYVVPVYQGHIIQKAVQRLDLGGRDLTDYLMKLLCDSGYSFATSSEREEVQRMKEKVCYVAFNFEDEMKKLERGELKDKSFTLPDGKTIKIGYPAFQTGEVLFNPKLMSHSSGKTSQNSSSTSTSSKSMTDSVPTTPPPHICGIHELVHQSITKCDTDYHKDLYCNIVMSGGCTMFPGIRERFSRELNALAPPVMRVMTRTPPERKYSAWIGGSIYGSIARRWITKEDYIAHGPTIVHEFSD